MSYTAPVPHPMTHALTPARCGPGKIFTTANATTWPTADLVIYVPVVVQRPVVVYKLFVANGTAVSGNFDIGLYNAAGVRLVSSGTTAQSGTNTEQVVDVTDTVIGPGLYYIALVFDNTTAQCQLTTPAAPQAAAWGVLTEQLGAGGALPATATFAVPQTLAKIPTHSGALFVTTVS